jgi:S1-C subfamily serine protease
MRFHLRLASILLIAAIALNLAMLATFFILGQSLGDVSRELERLEEASSARIGDIEEGISSLNLNTSEKLHLVETLLEELGGEISRVDEEGRTLRSELDYATTVSNALESVVLVLWHDRDIVIGSGFFVSNDTIMTAGHVAGTFNGKQIRIKTRGGGVYNASLTASDNNTDLAALRINASMPFLEWGDSAQLSSGSRVFALGAPEGFGFSASEGIVGAVRTSGAILEEVGVDVSLAKGVYVIQTDAAITHGNSGGPLIDSRGNVIGVNSFGITVRSGSAHRDVEGLNFAIASNDAKAFLDSLDEYSGD